MLVLVAFVACQLQVVSSNTPRRLFQEPVLNAAGAQNADPVVRKTVMEEFRHFMRRSSRTREQPAESWGFAPVPDFSHHEPVSEYTRNSPFPPPLMADILKREYKKQKQWGAGPDIQKKEESIQLQVSHAPFVMLNYGHRRLAATEGSMEGGHVSDGFQESDAKTEEGEGHVEDTEQRIPQESNLRMEEGHAKDMEEEFGGLLHHKSNPKAKFRSYMDWHYFMARLDKSWHDTKLQSSLD